MDNFIHKNRPCDGRGVALLRLIPMPQDIMAKNTINIFVILLIAILLQNSGLRRSSATPYSHFPLPIFNSQLFCASTVIFNFQLSIFNFRSFQFSIFHFQFKKLSILYFPFILIVHPE